MSFKPNNDGNEIVEINMIPFIDIMLVLLVIFIIASPLITNKIPVELPQASSQQNEIKKNSVEIIISADNKIYISDESFSLAELPSKIKLLKSTGTDQINIKADKNIRYDLLATVMASVQNEGISKLGFVTSPN